jgi:hypothetical protein
MRLATFAAAFLVSAPAAFAQAPTSAPAASRSPANAGPIQVGTYDIELAIGGGTIAGTLELKQLGDSLAATIKVGDHNPPPVRSLTRTGSQLDITAGDTGTNVSYRLKFAGDTISGTFVFNGDPGFVAGKRRK